MVPFLTYIRKIARKDIQTLSPYVTKGINHNVVNESKVMNISHTILGNPYHSGNGNQVPPLEDMGADMIVLIGITDHTDPNREYNGNDTMHMTRLNPCVSYNNEEDISTSLIPFDEVYIEYIKSDKFRKFLQIDGTTKEGQQAIANYYDVSDEWDDLSNENNDFLTQYYNLLHLHGERELPFSYFSGRDSTCSLLESRVFSRCFENHR